MLHQCLWLEVDLTALTLPRGFTKGAGAKVAAFDLVSVFRKPGILHKIFWVLNMRQAIASSNFFGLSHSPAS